MKTIYKVSILCAIALWGTVTTAHAQEVADSELTRQMTLEREYDPSVQDANKVNTLPVIKEPEVRKVPIDYASSVFSFLGNTPKEITTLPSGNIMTDMNYNKRRGYLNLAGGTYMNLNGDFGYHILSTESDQLNVFASHRSTNGNEKYIQDNLSENWDEKVKAKLNDNLGGINYRHQFERLALKLGATYNYSAFNYYGLPAYATALLFPQIVPDMNDFGVADRETNQVNQAIQATVGVASNNTEQINYLLDINYTNFSQKYGLVKDMDGPTEHTIGTEFGLNIDFGNNQNVGIEGKADYFNYSIKKEYGVDDLFESFLTGTVSPFYKQKGDNWNLKLGLNVMYVTKYENKLFVSPNVTAEVEVANKTVLYLRALGEVKANNFYGLSQENRYIAPYLYTFPSRTSLDGTIGLRSGVAPGFWFDIFGGYKITDDDCFQIPSYEDDVFSFDGFHSVFLATPLKTKRLQAGAHLKYAYQELFEIALKGVYNNWDVTFDKANDENAVLPEFKAYGRPEMEINAGVTVRPVDKLAVMLDYYLASGRYTLDSFYLPLKMKNINELNLTTSYAVNDTFGAYIKVSNLLSQKYDVFYGYPAQGISAMVGININF